VEVLTSPTLRHASSETIRHGDLTGLG
jgi:hypothetical protein